MSGGTTVLTDKLLEFIGKDVKMIIGVIGREIWHVDNRRSLYQIYRAPPPDAKTLAMPI